MRYQKSKVDKTHPWLDSAKKFAHHNTSAVMFVLLIAIVGTYGLTRSFAAAGSDLVVTNITMSPATPLAGQAVTFSATVRNQGTNAVAAGTVVGVGFAVDGQRVTWNETNTAGLAAGSSVTLTANAGTTSASWTATSGPHTLVATADDTNAIPDELDEGNNSLSQAFTIGNTGNLYVSPVSSSVLLGNNLTIAVRLNPSINVDGVQATLTYDQTKLQFVSMDATTSPFDQALGAQTGGSGTVNITRGNLSTGVAADALVANVTFKALVGSGSATLQIAGNATKSGAYTNPTTTNATVNFTAPDTTAPSVSFNGLASGATLFTVQSITINSTDNVGVTKVELYVDNQLKGSVTTSPYSFSLNTATLANGAHTLLVKSYDAAGNIGSATLPVTVKNLAEDINQDGSVNLLDFSLLAAKFGQSGTGLGRADINGDSTVNILDFSLLAAKFGQ